jgi:hypothetical protein
MQPESQGFFDWLQNTSLATSIADSPIAFPWIESFHVMAAAIVVGLLIYVDLRLLGRHATGRQVTKMSAASLPWVWAAFCISVITGVLMFSQTAVKYSTNKLFLSKMILLVVAGINMGVFHFSTWKSVDKWDLQLPPPASVRFAGAASLMLWLAVIVVARWIGFSLL